MVLIGRDWQPKVRQTGIDQQVVVPGMGLAIAGFYDIHTCDTEFDTDRIGYGCAVCRHYEKDAGAIGRCCTWQGRRFGGCFAARRGLRTSVGLGSGWFIGSLLATRGQYQESSAQD
jgi:hypothetical protein